MKLYVEWGFFCLTSKGKCKYVFLVKQIHFLKEASSFSISTLPCFLQQKLYYLSKSLESNIANKEVVEVFGLVLQTQMQIIQYLKCITSWHPAVVALTVTGIKRSMRLQRGMCKQPIRVL